MENIEKALALAVISLVSDQNYAQSLASYRFWSDVGHTYHQIPPDQIFDVIWKNRGSSSIDSQRGQIFHPTAHLIVRFVSDTESDRILAPYTPGLQSRLCTKTLHEFFSGNPGVVWDRTNGYGRRNEQGFYSDANLIAHWANLGYVEEAATRHHVLQSLISYSSLWDHQADALIILFKLAGATFEAYADPSVVDRCFELLKNYCTGNPARRQLVEVRASHPVKSGHRPDISSGHSRATGAWVGGSPSPTHIHDWKAKIDRHGQKRPRRNFSRHIPGAPQQRSRTSDPSAPFTRIVHRPRS